MSSQIQLLITALQAEQLHVTQPRKQIYEILLNNEPLSMDQLIQICLPDINRSSVYRTIELFEHLGIVQRLHIGWKYKLELSNSFQEHHHHLSCSTCGVIQPLDEDEQIETRLAALAQAHHFIATDHQLEVRGICRACQQRELLSET